MLRKNQMDVAVPGKSFHTMDTFSGLLQAIRFPPILSLIVLLVLIVIVYAAVALAAKRIDIDRLRGEQE